MELVGTHTHERKCERQLHSIGMDTGRLKSKREAKDNLEEDGGEGKNKAGWTCWEGGSQSAGME